MELKNEPFKVPKLICRPSSPIISQLEIIMAILGGIWQSTVLDQEMVLYPNSAENRIFQIKICQMGQTSRLYGVTSLVVRELP